MNATYAYGSKRVEIENGVIVASDSAAFVVGDKADVKRLVACGWKKAKKVTHTDVWGRRIK